MLTAYAAAGAKAISYSDARECVRGGNGESLRLRACTDALHIARRALFIRHGKRDPVHELVAVIHVKHEHAAAAPCEVVADAVRGDVEQVAFGFRRCGKCEERREDERREFFVIIISGIHPVGGSVNAPTASAPSGGRSPRRRIQAG